MNPTDPSTALKEMLSALRSEARPAAPGARPDPAPKPEPAGMSEFLMRRLESLETELRVEREASALARAKLDQREANRGEVEEQVKALSEALRSARDSAHAQGRIEALEARLEKMQEAWSKALDTKLEKLGGAGFGGALDTLGAVSRQVAALAPLLAQAAADKEESARRVERLGWALAEAMERTAAGLSARLDETARELAELRARLEERWRP